MMRKFEILRRERLLNNPFLSVEKQLVRLPNGETTDWYINIGCDVVIVIAVQPDGQIVFQQGYKHGSGNVIQEFCAGMIDEGETPLEAAKRELLEETGYSSNNWTKLGKAFPNPTSSGARYHFFLAQAAEKTAIPVTSADEQIRVLLAKDYADLEKRFFLSLSTSTVASIAALTLIKSYLLPS